MSSLEELDHIGDVVLKRLVLCINNIDQCYAALEILLFLWRYLSNVEAPWEIPYVKLQIRIVADDHSIYTTCWLDEPSLIGSHLLKHHLLN